MFKSTKEAMQFLDGLKPYLKSRIIGQDHVIDAISEKLRYWYLGISNPNRPTVFFFLGPTGTGKTEIIRETIHYLYGDEEEKLLRLDMSEFGETAGADVGKKLVGYTEKEPGRLYDFLEKNTEGAILYDEFEKAHKDMAKYMLQQIDAGRVTLWNNRTYDISRFLLFFTSNVGAEIFQGNTHLSMARKTEAACQRLVMMFNSPEFVARFGKFGYGIFAFNSLKPEHLRLITRKFIDDKLQYFRTIRETQQDRPGFFLPENMNVLGYSPEVVDFALLQTNTTKNGAREIRDIVERMLNQAYDLALIRDPSGKNMTGYLNIAPVMENEIPREAVVLQHEIPVNCIRIISD